MQRMIDRLHFLELNVLANMACGNTCRKDVVDSRAWWFEHVASQTEFPRGSGPNVPGLPVGDVA